MNIRYQSLLLISMYFLTTSISCKENLLRDDKETTFASYNHTALVVKNLDSSVFFYNYMFDFDTIHYPFPYREEIRAKWMSTGKGSELHLGEFVGDTAEYYYPGHIGLLVSSIDTILSRLTSLDMELPAMEKMPTGERTIHISDPDGNNIHIIESMKHQH